MINNSLVLNYDHEIWEGLHTKSVIVWHNGEKTDDYKIIYCDGKLSNLIVEGNLNDRFEVEGLRFDSKSEFGFFCELQLDPNVTNIEHQVKIPLVDGVSYFCDFVVTYKDGREVFYDVKGYTTKVYKIKKKLVKSLRGIDIIEVKV